MQSADQASHHETVSAIENRASVGRGGCSCEGNQVSTNGTVWPWSTVKSATVWKSSPRVATGVHKRQPVGSGGSREQPVLVSHPWDGAPVTHPDGEAHPHRDGPLHALDESDHLGVVLTDAACSR